MEIAPNAASNFLSITPGRLLRIWWAWTWRWLLFAAAANFVLYVPLLGISLILGGTKTVTQVVGVLAGIFMVFAAQVYTLWNLFGKDFPEFELCLVEKQADGTAVMIAPELRDAIRIWWAWFWRQLLVGVVLGVVWGTLLGVIIGGRGAAPEDVRMVAWVSGALLNAGIGIAMLGYVVGKEFPRFRIRLLPRS